MIVWMSPKNNSTNEYNLLFSESLERCSIDVRHIDSFMSLKNLNFFKLILKMKKNDILHLHWPSLIYQSEKKTIKKIKIKIMLMFFRIIKYKQVKLVWTAHNLYPHDTNNINEEKTIREKIINYCDLIFTLSEGLKKLFISEFNIPDSKVKVIKHGHYYRNEYINKSELIESKNKDCVFLFVGQLRPYKGIEDLVKVFTDNNIEDAKLIIAGNPNEEMRNYLHQVEQPNITKIIRFITREEMLSLINKADYIILPYKNITTSGTAILGVSFDTPIIMPDNIFSRDYLNEEISITYNQDDDNSLYNVIKKAVKKRGSFKRKGFIEFKKSYDWDKIGIETYKYYKNLF
jgi:beta-1,4-mannosyltransferase